MGTYDGKGGINMKKMLLILAIISMLPQWSFAESFGAGHRLWLSAFFELQESKMKVDESIKQIDLKIAQNEQEIRQINELLAKIQRVMIEGDERQRENAQKAKLHTEEALRTAKMTQKKLKEQKMELEWQKTEIEQKEARLKELYTKITTAPDLVGFIKECSGNVKIINLKTNKLEDACSSYMPISEGDKITTSSDGRLELKILDGRGNFIIGPNTTIAVVRKSADEEGFELIEGKAHAKVSKLNEYIKKMEKVMLNYKEDLKKIGSWINEKIEDYKKNLLEERKKLKLYLCATIRNEYYAMKNGGCVDQRNLSAVLGVRGTELVVETLNDTTSRLFVIEGSVDVTDTITNNYKVVIEGYEAIINFGKDIHIKKIENLERWWER